MPELPEVETIRQELNKKILGKKINNVDVFLSKIINVSPQEFKERIIKSTISAVERRSKNLIVRLSNNENVIFHLKMTGQLIFIEKGTKREKHTHLIFSFSDGTNLLFNDQRQFGYAKLLNACHLQQYLRDQKFGPEPLEDDFTFEKFKALLKNKKGKIKVTLMDAKFIAGIGNLYAAEICFYAKTRPDKAIRQLDDKQIKNIYDGIKIILKKALKHKGSSVENYVDIFGRQGGFVPYLQVYGREGKKCYRCGGVIKSVKLGGRSTFFCPNCQK